MALNKNHSQISKFFKNPIGNILIIEINEDISQFYLDLFRYHAHENKIEISIIKGDLKNENVDLFSTKKINIQYLTNKNKIDAASNETGNIIFTDYRNYKLFNQKFIAINSYDYLRDISNLILTEFQIQDDDFIAYCNDQPSMTFSELSKYSINKDNYLQNSKNNQNGKKEVGSKDDYSFSDELKELIANVGKGSFIKTIKDISMINYYSSAVIYGLVPETWSIEAMLNEINRNILDQTFADLEKSGKLRFILQFVKCCFEWFMNEFQHLETLTKSSNKLVLDKWIEYCKENPHYKWFYDIVKIENYGFHERLTK
mgnify:CR=1 FL=1